MEEKEYLEGLNPSALLRSKINKEKAEINNKNLIPNRPMPTGPKPVLTGEGMMQQISSSYKTANYRKVSPLITGTAGSGTPSTSSMYITSESDIEALRKEIKIIKAAMNDMADLLRTICDKEKELDEIRKFIAE